MENSLDINVILLCIAIGLIIVIGLIVLKQKPRIIIIKENVISESTDEKTIKEKNGKYAKVYNEDKAVIDSLNEEVRNLKNEIANEKANEKARQVFKRQNTYPTHA